MPGWNFAAVWPGIAAAVPDREALVCGAGRWLWRAFDERASRLASYWHHEGLRPGDAVVVDHLSDQRVRRRDGLGRGGRGRLTR